VRRARAALLLVIATALLAAAPAAAAPSWLAPSDLSAAGGQANEPAVAIGPGGDAIAVWRVFEAGGATIVAANRPPGGPWEPPVPISTPGLESFSPTVIVDAAGEATVVWEVEEDETETIGVVAASRTAGGVWGPPQAIGSEGEAVEQPTQLTGDDAGEMIAAWTREEGGHSVVEVASRPPGGGWSAPAPISLAGEEAHEPRIALNQAGDAAAIWEASAGVEEVARAAWRPAGGAWGAPALVTAAGEEAAFPVVGLDAGGDLTAVWERTDATNFVIREADRTGGGSWSTPRRLSPSGVDSFAPELAVDPGDDATAAWERSSSGGTEIVIEAASRPGAGAWGGSTPLSPAGGNAQLQKVGLDAAGDATAVWREGKYPTVGVAAATRPATGGWGAPVAISTPGAANERPALAVDPDGDAIAVWERLGATDSLIQAATFDAVGPSLRSLSIPGAGKVGAPLSFSVAPLDAISPVVATTWSFGDGGSAATPAASHTYAAPGTFAVTVSSVDAAGNTSTASGQVTISATAIKTPPGRAAAARLVKVEGGNALLSLSCPAGAGACAGTAKLGVSLKAKPKRRARSRPGRRHLALGASPFSIAAGRQKTVGVKLKPKGLALVRAAAPAGLTARLEGSGLSPRSVLLKQAPRQGHHGGHAGPKRGGR
jgi:hypothetical protein